MMTLAETASILGGRMAGPDVRYSGVSSDSRGLHAGELFVALRGVRHDGHAYLKAAQAAGATGALVDQAYTLPAPLPAVQVADTRQALGALARAWRGRFALPLIGIAGSNGKTTTKEMLAAILRRHAGDAHVLATQGNFNNDIGLPLTLLRLRAVHRYGVVELGMNHRGEIALLADIARPTVAAVTNAQREHLEFMGSVDEVAEENADLYRALAPDGVAVVNVDDERAEVFQRAAGTRRIVGFGLRSDAQVTATFEAKPLSSLLRLRIGPREAATTLAIPGLHNIRNALAAASCAFAAGVPIGAIASGLADFRPYRGRLEVKHAHAGGTVIDDTYNANPDSVRAAIDVLSATGGSTILVLGDMGEVGEQGPGFHAEMGRYARERCIGALYAAGELARHAASAFGSGGQHFADRAALAAALQGAVLDGVTVLVKGSRFMRMEQIVATLTGEEKERTDAA